MENGTENGLMLASAVWYLVAPGLSALFLLEER
jgi:hypothetical protein